MEHIPVEQIIDFVSSDALDAQTQELARLVNGHIRRCEPCRRRLLAFQMIHDELSRVGRAGGFRRFSYAVASRDAPAPPNCDEASEAALGALRASPPADP